MAVLLPVSLPVPPRCSQLQAAGRRVHRRVPGFRRRRRPEDNEAPACKRLQERLSLFTRAEGLCGTSFLAAGREASWQPGRRLRHSGPHGRSGRNGSPHYERLDSDGCAADGSRDPDDRASGEHGRRCRDRHRHRASFRSQGGRRKDLRIEPDRGGRQRSRNARGRNDRCEEQRLRGCRHRPAYQALRSQGAQLRG